VSILRLIHRYHNLILLVSSGVRYLSEGGALHATSSWSWTVEREFHSVLGWSGYSHSASGGPVLLVRLGELFGSVVVSSPIYRGRTPLVFLHRTNKRRINLLPNQVFCRTKCFAEPTLYRTRYTLIAEYTRTSSFHRMGLRPWGRMPCVPNAPDTVPPNEHDDRMRWKTE
jgi:hypothetical protein